MALYAWEKQGKISRERHWNLGLSKLLSCVLGLLAGTMAKGGITTRQLVGQGWGAFPTPHYVVQQEGQMKEA